MTACDLDIDAMTGAPLEQAKLEVQEELDRQKEELEWETENEEFEDFTDDFMEEETSSTEETIDE